MGRYTRKINPRLGFLGLLGLLGFAGIFTYRLDGSYFPFAFFCFFGFTGFYFEGRLGGTLRDEMFEQHAMRAKAAACNTGLVLVVLCLFAATLLRSIEAAFLFLYISLSLIFALTLFLSGYLLYRYEKTEPDNG